MVEAQEVQAAQNTKLVQEAYAAFSRGDIQRVIAALDEQIAWHGVIGAAPNVPMAGERRGKPAVSDFFKSVG